MKKKSTGVLILLLTGLLLISACSGSKEEKTADMMVIATNRTEVEGTPVYGGRLTVRGMFDDPSFDQATPIGSENVFYWGESLWSPIWKTEDRNGWKYTASYIPSEFMQGWLAESWSRTDNRTFQVKLREGIKFQNKAPVNGREMTAADVKYSYDRLLGTGSGFSEKNRFWVSVLPDIESIDVIDDYTVNFNLNTDSGMAVERIITASTFNAVVIIPHEWVETGDTRNWELVCGTGPYILTDYQPGVSMTMEKNPDYWAFDERNPENRLPYIEKIEVLRITDFTTASTQFTTGAIDSMGLGRGSELDYYAAKSIITNAPETQIIAYAYNGDTLEFKCDIEPFSDIRVRKALQMAIDSDAIAETLYGYSEAIRASLINPEFAGDWCVAFENWPDSLKEEYSYNPDKAKSLLAEAGYPEGFSTSFLIPGGEDTSYFEMIKMYWAQIGVEVTIESFDTMATVRSIATKGNYTGLPPSSKSAMAHPPTMVLSQRLSGNAPHNWTWITDSEYDGMYKEFLDAPSIEAAKELSQKMDLYLAEKHYNILTTATEQYNVYQPWVKGLTTEYICYWPQFYYPRMWIDK